MRRTHLKRRAAAVAGLAIPIAAFALATASPSGRKAAQTPAPARAATTAPTTGATPDRFPEPKEVRAVHVSMAAASDPAAVDAIVAAANPETGINAVVVDIKDELGVIAFDEGVPALARRSGAARRIYEPLLLVPQLHAAGLAFDSRGLWKNYSGRAWLNPYDERNWGYAIDIARAAGRLGFDEIQFDYVRFPTDGPTNAVYPHRTRGPLSRPITRFLQTATRALHEDHVRVSADLFGLDAQSDQGIGQDPKQLRNVLDVISPMIYPQAYAPGSYGMPQPQKEPYGLISVTLQDWQAVLAAGTAELRPWLQAYTLGGPHYGADAVQEQVRGVRGSRPNGGFSLWNAAAKYEPGMLVFPAR